MITLSASRLDELRAKKLQELMTCEWEILVESLAEYGLFELLPEYGIEVSDTTRRWRGSRNGYMFEFDIIAENRKEAVVVEVRTPLTVDHVKDFLWEMNQFKEWMRVYQDTTVYGAVACLEVAQGADIFAAKHGLFVIQATGSSASITNAEDFKPRIFT